MITGDSYIGSNRQHRLSDQVSANTVDRRGATGNLVAHLTKSGSPTATRMAAIGATRSPRRMSAKVGSPPRADPRRVLRTADIGGTNSPLPSIESSSRHRGVPLEPGRHGVGELLNSRRARVRGAPGATPPAS